MGLFFVTSGLHSARQEDK